MSELVGVKVSAVICQVCTTEIPVDGVTLPQTVDVPNGYDILDKTPAFRSWEEYHAAVTEVIKPIQQRIIDECQFVATGHHHGEAK